MFRNAYQCSYDQKNLQQNYNATITAVLTIGIHDGLVKEFVLFHDDDFQASLSHAKVFKRTESKTPLLLPAVASIESYTCCQTLHNMKDMMILRES